jgi:hypothetical protein
MRLPVDHLKVRNEPKSVAQPRPAECLGWVGRLRPVGTGTKRQILTLDSLSNRDADRLARLGV